MFFTCREHMMMLIIEMVINLFLRKYSVVNVWGSFLIKFNERKKETGNMC